MEGERNIRSCNFPWKSVTRLKVFPVGLRYQVGPHWLVTVIIFYARTPAAAMYIGIYGSLTPPVPFYQKS